MSTITAILEADSDGSLHLPLPEELRRGKVRITATLESAEEQPGEAEAQRQRRLGEIMDRIRSRNPFQGIADPVAWQQELREDRPLPERA